jgi:hypothetical protein
MMMPQFHAQDWLILWIIIIVFLLSLQLVRIRTSITVGKNPSI